MDAKKPLCVVLSLAMACSTTVMALADENSTDVNDSPLGIVETEPGNTATDNSGPAGDEGGNSADNNAADENHGANSDAEKDETGENIEPPKDAEDAETPPKEPGENEAGSTGAGSTADNTTDGEGNNSDTPTETPSENPPTDNVEPETPSVDPDAPTEPTEPAEEPTPVEQPTEQPVIPSEKETVITYEKNPDLPVIDHYATVDDEGNIELPETGLIDFRFPETVGETTLNTIAAESFMGCKYFRTVTIPENITSIGDNAFADCQNLQYIVLEGRSDDTDLTLGANWSGEATVLFEEIAVEHQVAADDTNEPADSTGDNQTEEPKADVEDGSSDVTKDTDDNESTDNAGNNNNDISDVTDKTASDEDDDNPKDSNTSDVPNREDVDLPKPAEEPGADDAGTD